MKDKMKVPWVIIAQWQNTQSTSVSESLGSIPSTDKKIRRKKRKKGGREGGGANI